MPVTDAEVLDLTTSAGKAAEKAKKQNKLGVIYLTMAFQTDQMIGMIIASIHSSWPGGLACCIVEALHNKYVPQDRISMTDLCQALMAISMNIDEDPTRMFKSLVESRIGTILLHFRYLRRS